MIILIGALAVVLTYAMFASRNNMLAYPSGIFWMIFGADCYIHSTTTWDIYYLLFFASCFGMTIFCIFAGFGLREKKDTGTDEDEYIDEKGGVKERYLDETKVQADRANNGATDAPSTPSRRTRALRQRAKARKTGFGGKR